MQGTGSTHMECNYGDMFPQGWLWAQGIAPASNQTTTSRAIAKPAAPLSPARQLLNSVITPQSDETAFVMTGGNFKIGPIASKSWVIGYRSKVLDWNFRTTDFDKVKASVLSYKAGRASVTAVSRCKSRRLEVGQR